MMEFILNQATLLKKATAPIKMVAAEAIVNYSPAGIKLQAMDFVAMVVAVLRINSSGFDYFRCNEDSNAGVDVALLYQILESISDEESITIHGDDGDDIIGFIFQNAVAGEIRYAEMKLVFDIPDEGVDVDELQYEYEVVIGIPSEKFRRILMHLSFFGKTVNVCVTDNQVKISAVNEEIFLIKENGECIIGGVSGDNPTHFSFSFDHMASFLNASLLSDTVWIFHSYDSPVLLNCPIGIHGNIMFYLI